MATSTDRCMQAPPKNQKHGAAVNRRQASSIRRPVRYERSRAFWIQLKSCLRSLKTILEPPVPTMFRRNLLGLWKAFGADFVLRRPKTASRSPKVASRSEDDAHLRPKTLQDRSKTAPNPLLTPTWAQLGPTWPHLGLALTTQMSIVCLFRDLF